MPMPGRTGEGSPGFFEAFVEAEIIRRQNRATMYGPGFPPGLCWLKRQAAKAR